MLTRSRPQDPHYRAELEVIGDVFEQAARRREAEQRRTRPSWWRRALRAGWVHRAQAVPVVVIAALLVAGLGIRAAAVPVALVAGLGVAALGGWFWRWGIAADHPAAAALRPVLAVAYLVASAVVAP
ncbi:hypothetical protein [Pseudonocardia sp. NPDC049635]|uniref:hypothetical protein n=1 Tax=Pseudonocardia sp. NPDC049635 TaxID=3155506 RepID=UPI0033CAC729